MRLSSFACCALGATVIAAFVDCSSSESVAPATATGAGGHGGNAVGAGGQGGGASSGGAGGAASGGGDAGGAPDAGPDAAPPPPADAPALPCGDALADVYVTPANLPPMTAATRGDVVRCAKDAAMAVGDVGTAVFLQGITTPMKSGVTLYRVAFRTTRGDGSPGVSTARVYLPASQAALPLPVIVVGHPTTGLASSCAPSLDPLSNQDLALPWAGLGYAVIVPDYAGLGNEGVQAYLDNRDQAHSLLDGARALRKLLKKGALSSKVLAVGHSQGGGAVLSAQALAKGYGADGDLAGVIAFAPEWPTRYNSFGYVDLLNNPSELTIATGLSESVVAVMRNYAYFYNHLGPTHAGDGFPAANQSGIDGAVTSLCQTPLGGYLQGATPVVSDFIDDALRVSTLACIAGNGQGAGCVEPGKSHYAFLTQNFVTADPAGAPILFVQGLGDLIMPAASEAACNLDKLAKDGVTPVVCADVGGQHTTVVARNMDFALNWGISLLNGVVLPTCSAAGMPACTP